MLPPCLIPPLSRPGPARKTSPPSFPGWLAPDHGGGVSYFVGLCRRDEKAGGTGACHLCSRTMGGLRTGRRSCAGSRSCEQITDRDMQVFASGAEDIVPQRGIGGIAGKRENTCPPRDASALRLKRMSAFRCSQPYLPEIRLQPRRLAEQRGQLGKASFGHRPCRQSVRGNCW